MAELVACYYIPENKDPEEFGATAFAIFDYNQPRDTGHMASCSTWEVDGEFLWFYNDCIYGEYQDTVTSLQGWFSDGTAYAVERATSIVPDIEYDTDFESDW